MSREPNPEPEPIAAVVVGCGRIAGGFNDRDEAHVLTHAAAYRRLGVPLAGCCDLDPARARAFASRWGAARHGERVEDVLVGEGPLVASVCTPAAAQLETLRVLVRDARLRAVLLEKPLGASLAEAEVLAGLADAWGRPVLVNYFRAYTPFYVALDGLLRDAAWGALSRVVVTYSGTLESHVSHALERLIAGLGAPTAVVRHGVASPAPHFSAVFEAGPEAVFVPVPGLEHALFELDFLFARGRLRVVDSERRAEAFAAGADALFPGYATLTPTAPLPSQPSHELTAAVRALLQAARSGRDPARGLARALAVARVLAALAAP